METRAIIFDLDGTLTESKQPLEREMGISLARLFSNMPLAVFSGGALHQFENQLLAFLPKDAHLENLYLFPTSAAQCYTFSNGLWRVVYTNDFTPEEKEKIVTALKDGIEETHIVDDLTPKFGERIEERGSQITFSALGQTAPPLLKKEWDPDQKKRTPLWKFLKEKIPEFNIAMNAATSIDITREGINKAYGVGKFADMLDLRIPELLYVGDALFPGGNDAVVIPTGIPVRSVSGPAETAKIIEEFTSR